MMKLNQIIYVYLNKFGVFNKITTNLCFSYEKKDFMLLFAFEMQ